MAHIPPDAPAREIDADDEMPADARLLALKAARAPRVAIEHRVAEAIDEGR